MSYLSDIEIAQSATMRPLEEIAQTAGIPVTALEMYGKGKAKIDLHSWQDWRNLRKGKLILVSAISPTPAGEGKTTTTIGLADGLRQVGKKSAVALREPSLGPVFGVKGGAAGGGYAQVIPMEELNLHFTGDFHAIGAANNLLAAMLDNHIHHGNSLRIDTRRIVWRRAVDMNDRQLRFIIDGLGGKTNGMPREDGFDITVASEVMAVFCLATSLSDLKRRLSRMIVAYNVDNKPVTAGDLKAEGAMAALLKDAFKPNLVQTLEGTPAFVHGGPFANIAHGCNSVLATELGLRTSEYLVTEAGFGADLGAEKFLDIKCRATDLWPDAAVVVATVRALKAHGGVPKTEYAVSNDAAVKQGMPNLLRHVANLREIFHLPVIVAVNVFPTDSEEELAMIEKLCLKQGIAVSRSEVWAKGGKGAIDLAQKIVEITNTPATSASYCYELNVPVKNKIELIATRIYHADGVIFSPQASKQLKQLSEMGCEELPVCMAKTQYSFSDDAKKIGAPTGFRINVIDIRISAGAGFVVARTGDIMTMPGLPKVPSAEKIDIDENGKISGLF